MIRRPPEQITNDKLGKGARFALSPLTSHVSRLTSHVSPLTSHVSRLTRSESVHREPIGVEVERYASTVKERLAGAGRRRDNHARSLL
jgi:hypothetical protein